MANVSHENMMDYDDMDNMEPIEQDPYAITRPIPCDFCNKRFATKALLNRHMQCHQQNIDANARQHSHVCNICFVPFERKIDLTNHMKTHAKRQASDEALTEAMILEREEEERNKGRRKKTSTPRKRKTNPMPTRIPHQVKLEATRYVMSQSYDYEERDTLALEEEEEVPGENRENIEK